MSEPLISATLDDIRDRIASDSYFSDITVLTRDKGDITNNIQTALGTKTVKAAKCGACVIVMSPELSDRYPEGSGGVLDLELSIDVLENVLINRNVTKGTLKHAVDIARRLIRVLKFYRASGITDLITLQSQCIKKDDSLEMGGVILYHVNIKLGENSEAIEKVCTPTIASTGSLPNVNVTMTCPTAGSSIYFTTDATYPWGGNTAATLYTVPVAVAVATTFRAGASKASCIGSDINSLTI